MNKVLVMLIAASAGLSSAAFAADKMTTAPADVVVKKSLHADALKSAAADPAQLGQATKKETKKKKPKNVR